MDFKFKGRTWAGNIYHRFEAMCQEVDDFVTKVPFSFFFFSLAISFHSVMRGIRLICSSFTILVYLFYPVWCSYFM